MFRPLALAVLLTAITAASPAVRSQTQDATADQRPNPPIAEKARWPASENLQNAMAEVARLLHDAEAGMAGNQATPAQLDALANGIEQQIAGISVNDTTTDPAKKALALIIGEFGDGVDLMRNASHLAARRLGFLMAIRTANNYGKEFDHADWVPLNEK